MVYELSHEEKQIVDGINAGPALQLITDENQVVTREQALRFVNDNPVILRALNQVMEIRLRKSGHEQVLKSYHAIKDCAWYQSDWAVFTQTDAVYLSQVMTHLASELVSRNDGCRPYDIPEIADATQAVFGLQQYSAARCFIHGRYDDGAAVYNAARLMANARCAGPDTLMSAEETREAQRAAATTARKDELSPSRPSCVPSGKLEEEKPEGPNG